jgi:cation diffusion facilitator CzcD-associated flavoprotein CzcO
MNSLVFKACVIGSGPSGLACLINLIENKHCPIVWIDP